MSLYIKYIDIKTKVYKGLYQKYEKKDWGSKIKDYSYLSHSGKKKKKPRNKKKKIS